MDNFFWEVINYFSYRLQGVIRFKHVIKQIEIYSKSYHSFREDLYYLIDFKVAFQNEYEKKLTAKEMAEIERLLRMSQRMSEYDYESIERNLNLPGGYFISYKPDGEFVGYLICARQSQLGPYTELQYFKRMKDFADQYNSLCAFTTHFVTHIAPEIKLLVHSLDEHPEFNCFRKLWKDISFSKVVRLSFDQKVNQYLRLQREQKDAEFFKDIFAITDIEIFNSTEILVNDIREFVITYKIPFILQGGKTIDKVAIDAYAYRNTLRGIVEKGNAIQTKLLNFIEGKINSLEYSISKNKQKIKKFPIKENDVIFLKKNKIAIVVSVNANGGEYNCTYRLINKDLQVGLREGQCNPCDEIEKILKSDLFQSLKEKYNWKHYRLLEGYMQNKVMPMDWDRYKKENDL